MLTYITDVQGDEPDIFAGGFLFHMPVNHHAADTVPDMPFRHQILIPGAKLFGAGSAGCCSFTPDSRLASSSAHIYNAMFIKLTTVLYVK